MHVLHTEFVGVLNLPDLRDSFGSGVKKSILY